MKELISSNGNKVKAFSNHLVDFVFPKTCIICDERLPENNSNKYFCDSDLKSIAKVQSVDLLDFSLKVNADLHFSYFSFFSDDEFAKIIYHLKYRSMKNLGIVLGEIFGEKLLDFLKAKEIKFDFIIPVPLHKVKLRERGYNQSDFICRGITKFTDTVFVNDLVLRNKNTKSQTKLDFEERQENIKDAFSINEKKKLCIEGKNVILVDDVVTTGATLNEVIKVLKGKNCGKILCATLAMARD